MSCYHRTATPGPYCSTVEDDVGRISQYVRQLIPISGCYIMLWRTIAENIVEEQFEVDWGSQ